MNKMIDINTKIAVWNELVNKAARGISIKQDPKKMENQTVQNFCAQKALKLPIIMVSRTQDVTGKIPINNLLLGVTGICRRS